jgi:hypothetical protein
MILEWADRRFSRPDSQGRCKHDSSTKAQVQEKASCGPLRTISLVAAHFVPQRKRDAASQHLPRDLSVRGLLVTGSSVPAPTPETAECSVLSSSRRSGSCLLDRVVLSSLRLEIVVGSAEKGCSAHRCVLSVGMRVRIDAIDWRLVKQQRRAVVRRHPPLLRCPIGRRHWLPYRRQRFRAWTTSELCWAKMHHWLSAGSNRLSCCCCGSNGRWRREWAQARRRRASG